MSTSALGALINKLKQKPEPKEPISVKIRLSKKDTESDIQPVTSVKPKITMNLDNGDKAMEALRKLQTSGLGQVRQAAATAAATTATTTTKAAAATTTATTTATATTKDKTKSKKLKTKLQLEHGEEPNKDEEPNKEPMAPEGGPRVVGKRKLQFEVDEEDVEDEAAVKDAVVDEAAAVEEEEEAIPRKRYTPKPNRNTVDVGTDVNFDNLSERLPPVAKFDVKVSAYYMNNREKFVNFINELFLPYKKEMEEETDVVSCDDRANGEMQLLIHQKIVRDYMNLYSPYRGLLLYHGLGSGKTCSSIAIAEGMKYAKKVFIMTPASLNRNYMEEIKKCGDLLYRKNQYWQWIPAPLDNPEVIQKLASALQLTEEYIRKKGGAWLVDVSKPSNFDEISKNPKKQASLDEQLDTMISDKYEFLNYNGGISMSKLAALTDNYTKNLFDNKVIIIDEAHNFISMIVNKINSTTKKNLESIYTKFQRQEGNNDSKNLSILLYEMLMSAENARIVLLTGTPIINYPNEIGILFNILRGYIKTWKFTLQPKPGTNLTISKTLLDSIFKKDKIVDYMDYVPSLKTFTITRNPFGFESVIKEESTGGLRYDGVSNKPYKAKEGKWKERKEVNDKTFLSTVIGILNHAGIQATNQSGSSYIANKALPDTLDEFANMFIDVETGTMKNINKFKRRIVGLTSYFRSAQEELLPTYDPLTHKKIIEIPMSDYQFRIYEEYRAEERKYEKKPKSGTKTVGDNGFFKQGSSTYRMFSRQACNYAVPDKPIPKNFRANEAKAEEDNAERQEEAVKAIVKKRKRKDDTEPDLDDEEEAVKAPNDATEAAANESPADKALEEIANDPKQGSKEVEPEQVLEKMGGEAYNRAVEETLQLIRDNPQEFLSPTGLAKYSPKYLHILENIQDPDHDGLHLVYSNFLTLEGIGLFALTLEANGFAKFKLKRIGSGWDLDMTDDDIGKPCFAVFSGNETVQEREILRNIYNSDWNYIPQNIANKLRAKYTNNHFGNVIKVFMITEAGAEGINLRNTRFVHIIEPYWHPVRPEQVIGRARRICSHKDLPRDKQTVEVFVYIMVFTKEQLKDDYSITLRTTDVSKRDGKPITSDQKLLEISDIKAEINAQLLKTIKETSIDCATHAKSNQKEQLMCLSFGNPSPDMFTYNPSYNQDQNDTVASLNEEKKTWHLKEITIKGVKYALDNNTMLFYDYQSAMKAQHSNNQMRPKAIGTLVVKENGKYQVEYK